METSLNNEIEETCVVYFFVVPMQLVLRSLTVTKLV